MCCVSEFLNIRIIHRVTKILHLLSIWKMVTVVFFIIAYPSPLTSLIGSSPSTQYHIMGTRERQVQRTCISTRSSALSDFRTTRAASALLGTCPRKHYCIYKRSSAPITVGIGRNSNSGSSEHETGKLPTEPPPLSPTLSCVLPGLLAQPDYQCKYLSTHFWLSALKSFPHIFAW